MLSSKEVLEPFTQQVLLIGEPVFFVESYYRRLEVCTIVLSSYEIKYRGGDSAWLGIFAKYNVKPRIPHGGRVFATQEEACTYLSSLRLEQED